MIDVSEALDLDTGTILQVKRTNPGGYVDGLYVDGSTIVPDPQGIFSVQNPTPKEVLLLEQGERTKVIKKFITPLQLFIDDDKLNTIADRIRLNGAEYKIMFIFDYQESGYTRALGVRE